MFAGVVAGGGVKMNSSQKHRYFSFPRAAWECSQHRAAVLRCVERRRVAAQSFLLLPDAAWAACDRGAVTDCVPMRRDCKRTAFCSLSLRERVRVREGNSFKLKGLNNRVSLTPTPLPEGEGLNHRVLLQSRRVGTRT